MLHSISWGRFITAILSLAVLYYLLIFLIFYGRTFLRWLRNKAGPLILCLLFTSLLHAQDGKQGIAQANEMIRGYYDTAVQLMYAVSAIFGLIGAVAVFQSFNEGHGDNAKRRAAAWFGACIFLVVVSTVIKSFFGI
jgi:4-amino-4-deoxy-L-arabinose transferase-like glycosyltransferase